MYAKRFPIQLMKKKINEDAITYKFKWNNGTISIEPMDQLTPQMLQLVHQYELQQCNQTQKKLKLNKTQVSSQSFSKIIPKSTKNFQQSSSIKQKIKTKITKRRRAVKTTVYQFQENSQQSLSVLPQNEIQKTEQSNSEQNFNKTITKNPHIPRPNKDCLVKNIRKENGNHFFQTTTDQKKWIKFEDLIKDSPISLCDYLLSKVKFS